MTAQNDPRPASPVGGEALLLERDLLAGLAARLQRTALSQTDAQAHLQYQEAEAIRIVLAALSAPSVTGEAVAWRYRWPDQDSQRWEATTSQYLADRNTNLGAEIQPLGVIEALSPTAVEQGSGAFPAKEPVIPTEREDGAVVGLLNELVEACQPIAEKARRWDAAHGSSRRDSVQIDHRIGDFRRIRDLLDHKSNAKGGPS